MSRSKRVCFHDWRDIMKFPWTTEMKVRDVWDSKYTHESGHQSYSEHYNVGSLLTRGNTIIE